MMKYSIIVPVAPERSAPILEDIKNLDYPKSEYHILVIRGLNPSENRNKGIQRAKGEILLFLDDDGHIDSDLLKKADKIFQTYNPDILGGPQLTPDSDGFFAKASGYVISSWFGSNKMSIRYKKGKSEFNASELHLTSAICFIKKSVFYKEAAFNTNLFPGEDTELFARLKKSGIKMIYHPEIYIYHKRRPNLLSFAKQFFNYGRVYVQQEKRKTMGLELKYFLPSFCIAYTLIPIILLILHLIQKLNPWLSLLLAPYGVYMAIVILMSVYLSIKNKNPLAFFIIPIVYIAEHASYGLGMISALFKK